MSVTVRDKQDLLDFAPSENGAEAVRFELSVKKITLSTPDLSNQSKQALETFNTKFGDDEMWVESNGTMANIMLREVSVTKIREMVNFVSREYDLPANNILSQVLDAVLAIKSYGTRGGRRNFVDYNKERKVQNRATKEKQRGKLSYVSKDFPRIAKDVPPQMENKIICGDSTQILKDLPDNCVDLVFTSPPYNFGLDYGGVEDDQKWAEYFSKLFVIFEECIRIVKYGGRIVINLQPLYSDYMPSHHIISHFFLRRGLIWRGEILWEKNNYNCKYTAWGSWKSPSNPYLKYSWEFLEIFCKGNLKKSGNKEDADITPEEFKKWVYGKWSIAPERGMSEKYGHPAMFPEELASRVLKLFSFRNDFILDPFNGAGTTTVVAKKHGRRFLGIDVSDEYCKTAQNRINDLLL